MIPLLLLMLFDPATAVGEATLIDSLGDLPGAVELWREILEHPGYDAAIRAEALYRLGDGLQRLEAEEEAADHWRTLVAMGDHHPWTDLAERRLLALRRRQALVQVELPFAFDFDQGLGSWFPHSQSSSVGSLSQQEAGSALWQTRVDRQLFPVILTELDSRDPLGRVVLRARVDGFPAWLTLFVVDEQNRRFVSEPQRLAVASGWAELAWEVTSLRPVDGEGSSSPDPTAIQFLLLQDSTGAWSTDSGAHELHIDQVRLEPTEN